MRAILVDDERLARKRLATLLARHPEVRIVGEANSVQMAQDLIEEVRPNLVFLDIHPFLLIIVLLHAQLGGDTLCQEQNVELVLRPTPRKRRLRGLHRRLGHLQRRLHLAVERTWVGAGGEQQLNAFEPAVSDGRV